MRLLAMLLMGGLLAAQPATPILRGTEVLENGVLVVARTLEGLQGAVVAVHLRVGAMDDPEDLVGATRMLQRLHLRAATANRPSLVALEQLQALGAEVSGDTLPGSSYTCVTCPPGVLGKVVTLVASQLEGLVPTPGRIQHEVRELQALRREVLDAPVDLGLATLYRTAFPVHPAGRGAGHLELAPPVAFTPERIDAHRRRCICGASVVVVVGGPGTPGEMLALAREAFAGLPSAGEGSAPAMPAPVDLEERTEAEREASFESFTPGRVVLVGYRAPPLASLESAALLLAAPLLQHQLAVRLEPAGGRGQVLLDPFRRDPGLVVVCLQHPGTRTATLVASWDEALASVLEEGALDGEQLAALQAGAETQLDGDALLQSPAARMMRGHLAERQWAVDAGRFELHLAGVVEALRGHLAALDVPGLQAALRRCLRPGARVVVADR
jgi:hypothetical protein